MRLIALAALLLPSLSAAQGLGYPGGGSRPLFQDEAGDVLHVYWDGVQLKDVRGNAWTMNGTVPQIPSQGSPFSPPRAAAGPYSAANSYQGPAALLGQSGDFNATVVWRQTAVAVQGVLLSKLDATATVGWYVSVNAGTGTVIGGFHDGSFRSATTVNVITLSAVSVLTIGKSAGTCYSKLNDGATATVACGAITASPAEPIRIGRYGAAAAYATTATIYEIKASSTVPFSDALHSARYQTVLARIR